MVICSSRTREQTVVRLARPSPAIRSLGGRVRASARLPLGCTVHESSQVSSCRVNTKPQRSEPWWNPHVGSTPKIIEELLLDSFQPEVSPGLTVLGRNFCERRVFPVCLHPSHLARPPVGVFHQ